MRSNSVKAMRENKFNFGLKAIQDSLSKKIKYYKKSAREINQILNENPDRWGEFQHEFNEMIDNVFRDIMDFEVVHLAKGEEDKIYKLRKLFIKKFRKEFLRGKFIEWSFDKPYGYAGDFKIIEDIYENKPQTTGIERLFDNYFQQTAASKATRERKEDFREIIYDIVKSQKNRSFRIMNLASGPAREIKELLDSEKQLFSNIIFDCYDNDGHSLEFASNALAEHSNVNFIKKNAVRLALKKDVSREIPSRYDLIYSTGLFDYLDERIAVKLIRNLRSLINSGGMLVISNYREKHNNPSLYFMELAGDWSLVYRSEIDFIRLFLEGGFLRDNINLAIQRSGVMQYCFAKKE